MRRVLLFFVVTALCPVSALAAGPVFNVNSFADVGDASPDGVCDTGGGVCTLRAAVMEANTGPHSHSELVTINLQAGKYTLTTPIGVPDDARNGDLNLAFDVKLQGAGMALTIIDGSDLDRVLYVEPLANVEIADLTIQEGKPPVSPSRVGGGYGGGVHVNRGNLTVLRTIVRANESPNGGGGIYVNGSSGTAALTMKSSMVRINGAVAGGGIYAQAAQVTIEGSSVYTNTATLDAGGLGVVGGTLAVWNSTISENVAYASGGAGFLSGVTATFNNVTVYENIADGDFAGGGSAGGFYVASSTAALSNSFFYNKTRGDSGVFYYPDDLGCTLSTVTSNGYNAINAPHGCVSGTFQNVLPAAGAVGANGGLTATNMPPPGSLAIDTGDVTGCTTPLGAPLTTDQRGVVRPIGARCDLGAVEVEPVGDANGDGTVSVADIFYLINFLFAAGPVPLGRSNVNGDGAVNVADVFYLINYLFAGGPAPAAAA